MKRAIEISGTALALALGAAGAPAAEGPPESLALVERMVAAHGGIEAWRAAPSVSWVEVWESPSGGADAPTRVVVEQGRRRAYHAAVDGPARLAWDGERAWSLDYQGPPPRFVALLNYYFLNLPWVVMDPGVRLSAPGSASIPGDPTPYRTMRVTYEAGVGDTPDDYYLLYLHPETGRLHATEYIVTYRALLPEGVAHTPPHLLVYDGWTTVAGLAVPTHFTIYENEALYAACSIRDWSFREPFDEKRLEMPAGATVDTSTP